VVYDFNLERIFFIKYGRKYYKFTANLGHLHVYVTSCHQHIDVTSRPYRFQSKRNLFSLPQMPYSRSEKSFSNITMLPTKKSTFVSPTHHNPQPTTNLIYYLSNWHRKSKQLFIICGQNMKTCRSDHRSLLVPTNLQKKNSSEIMCRLYF